MCRELETVECCDCGSTENLLQEPAYLYVDETGPIRCRPCWDKLPPPVGAIEHGPTSTILGGGHVFIGGGQEGSSIGFISSTVQVEIPHDTPSAE